MCTSEICLPMPNATSIPSISSNALSCSVPGWLDTESCFESRILLMERLRVERDILTAWGSPHLLRDSR